MVDMESDRNWMSPCTHTQTTNMWPHIHISTQTTMNKTPDDTVYFGDAFL
jgi:hypothetical protein